jgi:hypothetical protein
MVVKARTRRGNGKAKREECATAINILQEEGLWFYQGILPALLSNPVISTVLQND